MQKDKFIQCEPDKALFSFDNQTEQLTARVTLKNISQDSIGFKLKSTNPLRYDVQPDALGKIQQGGQTTLVLFMKVDQGQTINTYKDQILVQTIKIQGDKEIAREQFNRRQHPEMQESYLKVAIDAPSRQVMGGLVNTGKYQEHVINVGAPESSVGSAQPIGGQIAQDYVLVEEDTNALQVSPAELHLNMKQGQGQARAVLRLVNESRHAIAFKVKSTNAQRYNIHPAAIGVVNHYSSQELIISISGEARFPEEVQFIPEEIIVQSFVLIGGTRFSPTMFKEPSDCPGFKQQVVPFSISIQEDWMNLVRKGKAPRSSGPCILITVAIITIVLLLIAIAVLAALYVTKVVQF